jgi:hypothetical protein
MFKYSRFGSPVIDLQIRGCFITEQCAVPNTDFVCQVCSIYCQNLARVLGRSDLSLGGGVQGPRYDSALVIPALTDQVSSLFLAHEHPSVVSIDTSLFEINLPA